MFRTSIYPSSGAYDNSVELPHWSVFLVRCVLVFLCDWVGVVSVFTTATPITQKHQHTSNQEHTTNVVIQQNNLKLLMMDILISKHVEHIRSEIK